MRPLHNHKAPPSGKKVGDMNIEELKRLMEKMDAEKGIVNPMRDILTIYIGDQDCHTTPGIQNQLRSYL